MTILIICGIVIPILAVVLFFITEQTSEEILELFCGILGVVSIIASVIIWIVIACLCYGWVSSEYKAKIINREYKTSYTREEIFYASDVIDEIRKLDRQRIEINGDLMRDKNSEVRHER